MSSEEYIFELAGFALNCAEMALSNRGSPRYSALRFLEIFRKIVDMNEFADCIDSDPFLLSIKEKSRKIPIERDHLDLTREGIQTLLLEFAEEAAKRV